MFRKLFPIELIQGMNDKSIVVIMFVCLSLPVMAVNVKNFGAVGDGITDDYYAIQKAINAAAAKLKRESYGNRDGWTGGSGESPIEELYFPAGVYRISKTLCAASGYHASMGAIAWRGEQGAAIKQDDPDADILYCVYRRLFLDGMTFDGGKVQIHLWTPNANACSVSIRNCTFKNSTDDAIRSLSRRIPQKEDDFSKGFKGLKIVLTPPYDVKYDDDGMPILKPVAYPETIPWFASNIINISNCEFLNCIRAFRIESDGVLIRDCRIVANPDTEGPVMVSGIGCAPNRLALWNIKAEAPVTTKKQYWILNEGFNLTCNDSVFESAQGMPLLRQNTLKTASHYRKTAGAVSINRCKFNAMGSSDNAVIVVDRIPSILKFADNLETSGTHKQIPLFKWNIVPDEKIIRTDVPGRNNAKYHFIIADNRFIETNIPQILKQYQYTADKILHRSPPSVKKIESPFSGELKAVDFGIIADGKTDNSLMLTRAMEAAGTARKTLILPSGKIRLGSTVTMPSYCSMRGDGLTLIHGDRVDDYDLFHTSEPVMDIRLRQLMFYNTKKVLNMEINQKSSYVEIADCIFYDTGANALNIIEVPGAPGNTVQAVFEANIFNCTGSLYTEAFFNLMDHNWFSPNHRMNNQAFLTVKNGTLFTRSFFGCPNAYKGKKLKNRITGEEKIWELGDNLRWIDNIDGNLYLFDTRFGGEGGGLCPIFNRAKGSIYIDGGAGGIPTNPHTLKCYLYLESTPERVEITGVSGSAGQTDTIHLCEPGTTADVKTCGVMMLRTGP